MKKSKSKPKTSPKTDKPKEFVPKQKKEYYVSPKEFTEELQNYYASNVITDKLALMIKNIAYGLAHAPNFINYTFKEDAIGDSLINMFNALKEKKYRFDDTQNKEFWNSILKQESFHDFVHKKYKVAAIDILSREENDD